MQYMLTPYSEPIVPWAYWENGFNVEELNWLQHKAKLSNQRAQAGGLTGDELRDVRRSHVSWLEYNQENDWIYKKLSHIVSSLNSQFYRFDLTGFGESLQLTKYDSSENGTYNWHVDYGGNRTPSRKLSIILQLSDPSEFEGGNLQIMTHGKPETIRKQRGLLIAFPSYQLHQVTPVIQGNRQSLVAWISGPAFK